MFCAIYLSGVHCLNDALVDFIHFVCGNVMLPQVNRVSVRLVHLGWHTRKLVWCVTTFMLAHEAALFKALSIQRSVL